MTSPTQTPSEPSPKGLRLVPVSLAQANEHVAAAIVGRPVARHFDDGDTLEINRVASDGTKNACSILYAACTRAAFALGYRRVITYTRQDESGASLRALSGWRVIAERPPRPGWSAPSRPRDNTRYDAVPRQLWESVA